MHPNAALLHRFYTAFKQKDYATMQACYADSATFTDEVFERLNAAETRAMWQMLIERGADLQIAFSGIEANEHSGSAAWTATYTFSQTRRSVKNIIQATFEFKQGKIVLHRDRFDFYAWSRQALGPTGWLLGWTPFLRRKVQQTGRRALEHFMRPAGR